MGKLTAESIGEVDIPLSVKLKWHLQGNHYPPVHEVFVPLCEQVIACANAGEWDTVLDMPNGLSRTVAFIVENLHLEPFCDDTDGAY